MVLTSVKFYSSTLNLENKKENDDHMLIDGYMSLEIVLCKDDIIDKVVVVFRCLKDSTQVALKVNVDSDDLEELRRQISYRFDDNMDFDILDSDVAITPDGNYVILYVRRANFELDELLSEIRWLNGNYRD